MTARTILVDRSRLPEPGPPPPFRSPVIQKTVLPSGLRVWTVSQPSVALVTITLLFRRGSADDPPGQEGLAAITVDMLDEGSGSRSAIEIHEELARLGAQLDSDIGSDAAALSLTVLSRFTGRALTLMADIATRPALREDDFARVRQLRLHRLTQVRDLPGAVADRTFAGLLFGHHPYGHTPLGTERALGALSVDDVRRFHQTMLCPSDATLIVGGDCDHRTGVRLATDAFADWTGAADAALPVATELPSAPRLNVVHRTGAQQSELRIGHVAVARRTPDYHALIAANAVLGGQFVSRVNLKLREEKGLTYGARTAFDFRRLPGPFVMQASVQTAGTAEAIHDSLEELAAIGGSRPVTGQELTLGVAALTRGYARNFETAEQVVRAIMQIVLYDLPDDYFTRFVPDVLRVTVDDVTRVASEHINPGRLTTLVVGDYEAIDSSLRGLGLGEPALLPPDSF